MIHDLIVELEELEDEITPSPARIIEFFILIQKTKGPTIRFIEVDHIK
jgi:Fe-S-cluster formation regulator IscX/YfhJ